MWSEKQAEQVKETSVKLDGWINALTGIGAALRDKSMNTVFEPDVLARQQLEAIWRGDDMAARIIETVPNEMLREGFEVCVQADDGASAKNVSEAVEAWCSREDINVHGTLLDALNYERAYGGAAILLGVNDGELDLRLPLRADRIKTFDWMNVLSAHELCPVTYYDDPRAPFFGRVKTWRVQPDITTTTSASLSQAEIHESRLVCFGGVKVSRRHAQSNLLPGWGDSVLVRCNRVLSNFHQTWSSAGILMQDFAQAILKIKDLADLIATNQDDVIIKRAQILDMSRSVARMTMIDAEEEFERKATPMTGLPDMLQQFALRLSAAADMPVTLLMGQSPAGLNATGASDVRFFYDRIKARQKTHVKTRLARIIKLGMLAKNGPTSGKEPENWSIKFNPLWQLTDLERADVRVKIAQADASDINAGILSPAEVAVSRYGGDGYSTETQLDLEGRKAMEESPREIDPTKPAANPAKPTDPNADPAKPAGGQELQVQPTLGMNGAQVSSMLSIVQQVASGALPFDAGVGMLKTAFNLNDEQAKLCFGSVGSGFEQKKPEPAPNAPPFSRADSMRVRAKVRACMRKDDANEKEEDDYELRAVNGFPVIIDRPKGTVLHGVSPEGVPWARTYAVDYGYIFGTTAPDDEGVDAYIGESETTEVYVIEQQKKAGGFDEPKVMMKFASAEEAVAMFLQHIPPWGLGPVKAYTREAFVEWIKQFTKVST